MFQPKKFCPSTCQFWGYMSQRTCFFNFNTLFQVWLLLQVPHPITWQKYLLFSNAEFNSASIDTNFINIQYISREIDYCFLFAMSRFWANLIKFTFSVFPDPSGRVGKFFSGTRRWRKIRGNFKKKKSSPYIYTYIYLLRQNLHMLKRLYKFQTQESNNLWV